MIRTAFCAALGVCMALASGCGVPTGDDSFDEIPPDEIPFGLDATSTTTTSTTTTTTTLPDAPATSASPSTVAPIRLEPVEIYFLSRGRLQPVVIDLTPNPSPDQIADVLEAGPPDDVALDTLVEDGLIVSSVESGGVLTVDLDGVIFDRIPTAQQTEAIAQIVLTMISSLRRVGQVTFTLDRDPIPVRKGNGLSSETGETVSYDDYVVLLVSPPTPPSEPPLAGTAPNTTGQ